MAIAEAAATTTTSAMASCESSAMTTTIEVASFALEVEMATNGKWKDEETALQFKKSKV